MIKMCTPSQRMLCPFFVFPTVTGIQLHKVLYPMLLALALSIGGDAGAWGRRQGVKKRLVDDADDGEPCLANAQFDASTCSCQCKPGFVVTAHDQRGKHCDRDFVKEEESRMLLRLGNVCRSNQVEWYWSKQVKEFGTCDVCTAVLSNFTEAYFPRVRTLRAEIVQHKIKGFYHVTALPMSCWDAVVSDQLDSVAASGLLSVGSLEIGFNGNATDLSHLKSLIGRHRSKCSKLPIQIHNHSGTSASWKSKMETPTLNRMRDYCLNRPNSLVYYFHSKGITKDSPAPYARVLHWRKYMEYFVLEHPSYCIEALQSGEASICGVDWSKHFSGNFWWATCEYVNTLGPPCVHTVDHTCGEVWIGSLIYGAQPYPILISSSPDDPHPRQISFEDRDKFRVKALWKSKLNLYEHTLRRSTYQISHAPSHALDAGDDCASASASASASVSASTSRVKLQQPPFPTLGHLHTVANFLRVPAYEDERPCSCPCKDYKCACKQ